MRLRESGPYSQRGMYLIKDITVFLDGEHGGKIGEEVDRDLQCVREQSQQSYEWHTRRTQGNFSLLKMHPLQQRRVCIIIVVSGAIARFPSKSLKISKKSLTNLTVSVVISHSLKPVKISYANGRVSVRIFYKNNLISFRF